MPAIIQLLTVENITTRRQTASQQKLVFTFALHDSHYTKEVAVVWCGTDGIWHELAAHFLSSPGNRVEYWCAKTTVTRKRVALLPGDIRFALRLRSSGQEFWDNNHGLNHVSKANSGIQLQQNMLLQNLTFNQGLLENQQWLTIKIAVQESFNAAKMTVHWTNNDWQTSKQTRCHRLPNVAATTTQIWVARLKLGSAFAIQYAITCQNASQTVWENNAGNNYRLSHQPLRIMILNLHCYQEDQQDHKFSQIAKAIDEQAVDVVCLQEVAEYWNHGQGDWASNAANIINQRLKQAYQLFTDWSHLGFDQYREGVAILSRYPLLNTASRYVSDNQDIYSIHSRKVVQALIKVPYFGCINVYSAHLSWWEDGFAGQFKQLSDWAESHRYASVQASLLCGDFNITAGSAGYQLVVAEHQYEDQYLAANHAGLFKQIFQVRDMHWQDYPTTDYRIDYIFMHKQSSLKVVAAKALFTEQDYGRVSDHCGYLMTFEPK